MGLTNCLMDFSQFLKERKLCAFVLNFNIFNDEKTQLDRGDPVLEEEFKRLKTEVNHKRIVHNLEEVGNFPLFGI